MQPWCAFRLQHTRQLSRALYRHTISFGSNESRLSNHVGKWAPTSHHEHVGSLYYYFHIFFFPQILRVGISQH
jgi:hypothetical protein